MFKFDTYVNSVTWGCSPTLKFSLKNTVNKTLCTQIQPPSSTKTAMEFLSIKTFFKDSSKGKTV